MLHGPEGCAVVSRNKTPKSKLATMLACSASVVRCVMSRHTLSLSLVASRRQPMFCSASLFVEQLEVWGLRHFLLKHIMRYNPEVCQALSQHSLEAPEMFSYLGYLLLLLHESQACCLQY